MMLPSRGATVRFHDGSVATGAVYRSWEGVFILRSDDGTDRPLRSFQSIDFKPQEAYERPALERFLWIAPTALVWTWFLVLWYWIFFGRRGNEAGHAQRSRQRS